MPTLMVLCGFFGRDLWWPQLLLGICFFGSCAFAAYPYWFKGASYTLWTIACLCFMLGAIPAFGTLVALSTFRSH
jgi:hypothetical protein